MTLSDLGLLKRDLIRRYSSTTVFLITYDFSAMANDDPESQERMDELVDEIRNLRNDFQEYTETTTQYQTSRRVENIQVLIALSVVGGAISLYSGGFLDTAIWQNQIKSRYWIIILNVFIGSNALFLILKLTTIPLLSVSNSGLVSFLHEEVEPFLYLFAILGVLFSLLMRVVSLPVYKGLSVDQRGYLAIASLFFPLLLAGIYAQIYRISSALQRERPLLLEINHILDGLVRTGAITAEMQARLMRNILLSITPVPALFVLVKLIEDTVTSQFDISEQTTETFIGINSSLVEFFTYLISPSLIAALMFFDQDLEDILMNRRDDRSGLSKEEEIELRDRISELRNKRAHGELTEEDVMELNNYLERLEENGSDGNR